MQTYFPQHWDLLPGIKYKRDLSMKAFNQIDSVYQQSSPEEKAALQERYDFLSNLAVTYDKPYAQRKHDYGMMKTRHGWEAGKRRRRGL